MPWRFIMAHNPKPIRKRQNKNRYEVTCLGIPNHWFPRPDGGIGTHTWVSTKKALWRFADKLFAEGVDEVIYRDMKDRRRKEGWIFYIIKK